MNDLFYGTDAEPGLRRGHMAAEFTNIGEGYHGDYDPSDPEDDNLLRYYVYIVDPNSDPSREANKQAIDDASYCTMIPADTPPEQLRTLLTYIMDKVYDPQARWGDAYPTTSRFTYQQLSYLSQGHFPL